MPDDGRGSCADDDDDDGTRSCERPFDLSCVALSLALLCSAAAAVAAADFLFSICSHPSADHHDEISSGLMTAAVALAAPLGDSGVGRAALELPLTLALALALALALLLLLPLAIRADAEAEATAAEEKMRASKAAISAAVAHEYRSCGRPLPLRLSAGRYLARVRRAPAVPCVPLPLSRSS